MLFPSFMRDFSIPPLEYHGRMLEWSREMRQKSPVVYAEEISSWQLFRYEDLVRMLSDYETFSSESMVTASSPIGGGQSIIQMDPPRHRQLRSLVTQAFSARTIGQMEPQIARIVESLLEKVRHRGEMDVVSDLANPLPVIVIAAVLGLPEDGWEKYKRWTDAIILKTAEIEQARQAFTELFVGVIQERSLHPGDDVLSHLIQAEVDGERLSREDILSFCFTLFIAGNITTTNMVGNAMLCLGAHPEQFAHLQAQPALAASAVEEILRYMPPARYGSNELIEGRQATVDTMIGEQLIRKGEMVFPNALPANFDETQFPDPERFDIERSPNRHQSFGHGIHFCLGAPLARLELRIVLRAIAEQLSVIQIRPDQPARQLKSSQLFGLETLPITFKAS